jgi:hypothetical protein
MLLNSIRKLLLDLAMASMSPPQQNVGLGEQTLRDALIGFVEVGDANA